MFNNVSEVESFGIIPLSMQEGEWRVLLILHQSGSHWSFPKGRSDGDETPLQSAKRELKEETGLEVEKLLQETPLLERFQFRSRGGMIQKTVHYFPALVRGEVKLQEEEIREARWLSLEKALEQLTFKEAKALLQQVIALLV